MNAYQYLAQAYDTLMSDIDYDLWAAYISRLLGQTGLRVYEVACGTGRMTSRLYDMGYRIVASDISAEMLHVAMEDARRNGRDIVFIEQDMCRMKAGNLYDAIVSACDGPNYLDKDQLSVFFKSAYAALLPGGRLLFDVSSASKLISMHNEVYFDDGDDVTCVWNNSFDSDSRTLTMDVVLFLRKGELYEKLSEQHVQHAHEAEEIKEALTDAGFTQIEVYDAFTTNATRPDSDRIQFLCRKV